MTRMQVWKNSWNSECFDIKVLNQCAWNIAFPAFIYLTYLMEYVWKSSLCINTFQRTSQRPRIKLTDNTESGDSCSVNY